MCVVLLSVWKRCLIHSFIFIFYLLLFFLFTISPLEWAFDPSSTCSCLYSFSILLYHFFNITLTVSVIRLSKRDDWKIVCDGRGQKEHTRGKLCHAALPWLTLIGCAVMPNSPRELNWVSKVKLNKRCMSVVFTFIVAFACLCLSTPKLPAVLRSQ